MTLRFAAVTLSLLLAVGCVPKAKLDAELANEAELNKTIDSLKAAQDENHATIAKLEQELKEAQAQLDDANTKLASKMQEAGALQSDIESMKAALEQAEQRKAKAEASLQAYRDLLKKFQAMIDAGTLKVKVQNGQMIVELATDILFPPGQATLSPEGKTTIQQVAQVLASIPDREFQVAGHTDSTPISSERFPSNWDLGAARAITVTRLLVDSGLPANRVSAASYADTKPVAGNDTKEGRAANRRIEILIVPDLSQMPGYDELQRLSQAK